MPHSVKDLYPGSNYLNAGDVKKSLSGEITAVSIDTMRSGDDRIVLTLENVEKKFACNATNARELANRFGDDPEKWVGETVEIISVPTQYQGQPVKGLRVQ